MATASSAVATLARPWGVVQCQDRGGLVEARVLGPQMAQNVAGEVDRVLEVEMVK